ncbi:MAG: hypothetical protein ABW008_11735 [Acidimicrobiales bacterium]
MTSPFGWDGANPMDPPQGPSSLGYWLGGLLIAGGIIGGIVWGWMSFSSFLDAIDDFERVPVGEISTIQLDDGDYVVYAERGGGEAVSLFVDDVRMRPAGQEGADEIEFEPYVSELTYDFGNHTGRAQMTFAIDETGEYDVRVGGGPGTTATTAAFGPSIARDLVAAIVGGFVIAGIGIVLGIILLVVTGVRRRKFRQRAWLGAWNGPGGAPQPGPWNPPPPASPGAWSDNPPPPAGYPPPPTA